MASIDVKNSPKVAGILARMESAALKHGVARIGAVRCTRTRRAFTWALNGNRCKKQDAAYWLETAEEEEPR